jgi:hypothetical protein
MRTLPLLHTTFALLALIALREARADAASTVADCSQGFVTRLAAAYRADAQPADSSAPIPARRALPTPFDSPPFPSAE